MIVIVRRIAPVLLVLSLASSAAHAEIHKCRQGDRVIYQENPCPGGSLSLAPPERAARPPGRCRIRVARRNPRDRAASGHASSTARLQSGPQAFWYLRWSLFRALLLPGFAFASACSILSSRRAQSASCLPAWARLLS